MANKPKANSLRNLARQKFFELGNSRTIPALLDVLSLLTPHPPNLAQLKYWSRQGKWSEAAAEFDREQFEKFNSLPESPSVIEERVAESFHARAVLTKIAESFANRVIEWSDDEKGTSNHIKSAHDARIMAECTVKLVGQVEVLEGRVSDRRAAEATITQGELKKKAESKAADMLTQLAHAVKKSGIEGIDSLMLN